MKLKSKNNQNGSILHIVTMVLLGIMLVVPLEAVCNWGISAFNGSNGCTSNSCVDLFCYHTGWGTPNYACVTDMDGCCSCIWYAEYCQCDLGPGQGIFAAKTQYAPGICTKGGICVHTKPPG